MRSGSSALHAIRLVIGGWRAREEASARASILGRLRYQTTKASPTFFNPAQQPVGGNFLEDDSDDYATALQQLPTRDPVKIPTSWPASTSPHPTSRPCDPVAKAVAQGTYGAARNLFEDLRSARIHIADRPEYLEPALDALKNGDVDVFMDWMEHYPYNLAVLQDPTSIPVKGPEVFKTLRPVIREMRHKHHHNTRLITRFLQLCGRKGMLPPIFEHFITDFATILPPHLSLPVMVDVLNSFGANIPETVDQDDRDAFTREIILPRMNKWLNVYMRRIAIAGWSAQAQTIYAELPRKLEYAVWIPPTPEITLQQSSPPARADEADGMVLKEKIRAALVRAPRPRALAAILDELDNLSPTHPTLATRLRRHLIRRPGNTLNPLGQTRGERRLDQAEIYRMCKYHQYKEAITYFLARYQYSGLPPHPVVDRMKVEPILQSMEPQIPTIHMITTVLPALIETLPDVRLGLYEFHKDYLDLARDLPPMQQPTTATHSVFLRKIVRVYGGAIARSALKYTAKRKFDPGDLAPTWLLLHYARRAEFTELENLLYRMQNRKRIYHKTSITYSPPPSETIDKMTEIVRTKAEMDPVYWEWFAEAMEDKGQE